MTVAEVVTAAVADFVEHGFDSQERLDRWMTELRKAISATMTPPHLMEEMLRRSLKAVYTRLVDNQAILRDHPGVPRFTLQQIAPQLRSELDRRIMASANLIKLNKVEMVEKTLRRFSGWATSIPAGGSKTVDRNEVKADIQKSWRSSSFEERRVLVDQGHKLNAAISATLAQGSGAIALVWHSHWRQLNYNFREDHKKRDENVYLLRDSWAKEQGLVKPGDAGYYDQITAVAEEPFCRCFAEFLYHLRQLPEDMLTEKGALTLERTKVA